MFSKGLATIHMGIWVDVGGVKVKCGLVPFLEFRVISARFFFFFFLLNKLEGIIFLFFFSTLADVSFPITRKFSWITLV